MAKGYWIAHVTVKDPEGYKEYVAANAIAFKKYNAKFLVRGGPFEVKSGAAKDRHVVLEFEFLRDGARLLQFARVSGRRQDPRQIFGRRRHRHRGLGRLTSGVLHSSCPRPAKTCSTA